MSTNPVIALLGRRLRLAVIGGGPGSFIGAMHRQAARLDDRYELVAAALSSDPARSLEAGRALGLPPERCHADGDALIDAQATLPDVPDTDGSGSWSLVELQAVWTDLTEETFKAIDTTADGAVDATELQAAVDGAVIALPEASSGG